MILIKAVPLKIGVITCNYGGQIVAEQARMWCEFGNVVGASSERFRLACFGHVDMQPITKARNTAIAQAMTRGVDWLLMIDSDTWVLGQGEDDAGFMLLRMISDAHRKGAILVGAPVVRRTMVPDCRDWRLAIYDDQDTGYVGAPLSWLEVQPRSLVPIHAIGAACIAINLNALAEIDSDTKPLMFDWPDDLSEDLDFCRQIRTRTGPDKIFADPRVRTAHLSKAYPLLTSTAG